MVLANAGQNHAEHAPQQQADHQGGEHVAQAFWFQRFIWQIGLNDGFDEQLLLLRLDACLLQGGDGSGQFLYGKDFVEAEFFKSH